MQSSNTTGCWRLSLWEAKFINRTDLPPTPRHQGCPIRARGREGKVSQHSQLQQHYHAGGAFLLVCWGVFCGWRWWRFGGGGFWLGFCMFAGFGGFFTTLWDSGYNIIPWTATLEKVKSCCCGGFWLLVCFGVLVFFKQVFWWKKIINCMLSPTTAWIFLSPLSSQIISLSLYIFLHPSYYHCCLIQTESCHTVSTLSPAAQ